MLQKFGKRVMNNFGLKILAVLFAVVLWIVVVNIDDPSNSKPYTTSVSLENKSYITSMGKWADYLDGKNTITFSVYAKRSVHNTLTNANFTATADAQKIEYDEKTGTYRVPVVVTCNRTAADVRHLLDKFGAGMGATGCVGWQFDQKGVMIVDREELDKDEDEVMMLALDAGAEDFQADEQTFTIYTSPADFGTVR